MFAKYTQYLVYWITNSSENNQPQRYTGIFPCRISLSVNFLVYPWLWFYVEPDCSQTHKTKGHGQPRLSHHVISDTRIREFVIEISRKVKLYIACSSCRSSYALKAILYLNATCTLKHLWYTISKTSSIERLHVCTISSKPRMNDIFLPMHANASLVLYNTQAIFSTVNLIYTVWTYHKSRNFRARKYS